MVVKNRCISAMLVASILTGYSINPVLAYTTQEVKTLNAQLLEKVMIAQSNFENYKLTNNVEDLKTSLKNFGDIAEFIQYESEVEESTDNEMYNLFINQREELYSIAQSTGNTQYIIDYANYILEGWKKNRNMTPYTRIFLRKGLIQYNDGKIASIDKELKKIDDYYFYLLTAEWETPEDAPSREWFDDIDSEVNTDENIDVSGPPPVYDEGDEPEPPTNEDLGEHPDSEEILGDDIYSIDTYYEKENNKCMRVQRKFKENIITEITKEEVPKEEYIYCGIYDYVFEDAPPPQDIEIDEEYIYTDQNVESNNYIYYTVNKNTLNPYYFNSGIRATLDSKVTYNQLKDVLYQISLKVKGFSTDSNNKSLAVIEGRPVVVTNEQEFYSKEQVESLLDSFELVDIKIQEYTDELKSVNNTLFDYIKEKSSIDISLDKQTFSLTGIEVSNNVLMVSLNEISQILNLKFEKENDVYTVKGKQNYIKFIVDTKSYKGKDNKEKEFLSKPKKKENDIYIDLETLCREMEYTIEWDSDNLILCIDKEEEK